MKHLILGNGAAGISAAQKLRELNDKDDITILSSEDTPVYAKIMLPDYIGGKIEREKLFLRDLEFYKTNRIELHLNSTVEAVDTEKKCVYTSGGRVEEYDKLLLAVGGKSVIPPIDGLNEINYFLLNSLADADKILQNASSAKKALIIGAGLTGIEIAFALKRLGLEVEIIDRSERILPNQLDENSSLIMADYLRNEGIGLFLGKTLTKIENSPQKAVEVQDGKKFIFDMLILAIGTRPNISILKSPEIKCNKGVWVDEFMRTSNSDIFAAGDIAETQNKLSKDYISSYIWPNAMAQGKCAAFNMAGQSQEFSSTASAQNSVQLRDMPFISMGMVNAQGEDFEILHIHDKEKGIYKRLILKDNIIKSMVFIGDVSSANAISGLIRKGTNVSQYKDSLLKKDFTIPK